MRKLRVLIALALIALALALASCNGSGTGSEESEGPTYSAGEDQVVALKLYFNIICVSLSSLQEYAESNGNYYKDDHGCTYNESSSVMCVFSAHEFTYSKDGSVYTGSFTGTVSNSDGYYCDITKMTCNSVAVSMTLSYSASSLSFSGSCEINGEKYSLTSAQVYEILGDQNIVY